MMTQVPHSVSVPGRAAEVINDSLVMSGRGDVVKGLAWRGRLRECSFDQRGDVFAGHNGPTLSGRSDTDPRFEFTDRHARPVRLGVWSGRICVRWFCGEDEHVPVGVANARLARSPRL